MAMKMGVDLGLSDHDQTAHHQMNMSERERSRRRATWQGILQLHVTSSSCKLFNDQPLLCAHPPSSSIDFANLTYIRYV